MPLKTFTSILFLFLLIAAPAFGTVVVNSPSNGEIVSTNVLYSANSSTNTCKKGVASMGVYIDRTLVHVVNGTILNVSLPVSAGNHKTVVQEWDYCGGSTFIPIDITVSLQAGVHIASPVANSTITSIANYIATATSNCPKGIAAMGIYVNNQLVHVENGYKLNTQLTLSPGKQHTVVEEWDLCGGASYSSVDLNVINPGTTLSNLQASGGWNGWGEFAPKYDICAAPCPELDWSLAQHINTPSLSGNATRFSINGKKSYSDVLWSNPVIGQYSTQHLPDDNHSLLPGLHNFTYDSYFYVTNASITQVLEFDISMYMNGSGMIWGTQCNNLGGKEWDIWDNVNGAWVSTGAACNLIDNAWNHVTLHAQRDSSNTLLYQSITLNGVTSNINWTYLPFSVPTSWWGITLNYQMDGNKKQDPNVTYLDNFSFTYW